MLLGKRLIRVENEFFFFDKRSGFWPQTIFLAAICGKGNKYQITQFKWNLLRVSTAAENWNSNSFWQFLRQFAFNQLIFGVGQMVKFYWHLKLVFDSKANLGLNYFGWNLNTKPKRHNASTSYANKSQCFAYCLIMLLPFRYVRVFQLVKYRFILFSKTSA